MPSNSQPNTGSHKEERAGVLRQPKEKRGDGNDLSQEVRVKVGLEERAGIW